MSHDFSKKFHQNTKNFWEENKERKNPDSSQWPSSWKTTFIKVYDRYTPIPLPSPQNISTSYSDVLKKRKSERSLDSNNISFETISALLFYSMGELDRASNDGAGRRVVSSAGARYPLEIYILILRDSAGFSGGLYHYRVDIHALEHIYDFTLSSLEKEKLFTYPLADGFLVAFFITAVFERNQNKYGDRGYRYILLEAGAVSQAIQNTAIALNINSVIFGGVYDNKVEELLGIDGVTESLVSTVLLR